MKPVLFIFETKGYYEDQRYQRIVNTLQEAPEKCLRLGDNCYLIRSYEDFSTLSDALIGDVVLTTDDNYYVIPLAGPAIGRIPAEARKFLISQGIDVLHTPAVIRREEKL